MTRVVLRVGGGEALGREALIPEGESAYEYARGLRADILGGLGGFVEIRLDGSEGWLRAEHITEIVLEDDDE